MGEGGGRPNKTVVEKNSWLGNRGGLSPEDTNSLGILIAPNMAYRYTHLDTSKPAIRLLHASAGDTAAAAEPVYELRNVSLDANPEFETISYCWGDPTPNHTVTIDGAQLHVPRSTAIVLARVSRLRGNVNLWVDAVCINQADVGERSQQVPLMGRIYSQASRNNIYLGEGDEMSLSGFEVIRDTCRETDGLERIRNAGLRSTDDANALISFFSLPWFSRVWVIQEAVLARESICMLADTQIDFDEIADFVGHMASMPRFNISQEFQVLTGLLTVTLMCQFKFLRSNGQGVKLKDALSASVQAKSTDLRDKVYGILGMCEATAEQVIDSGLLNVDYKKSYQDVFRDATRRVITTTGPSESAGGLPFILRWISHRTDSDLYDPSLPSWVPRFDREGDLDLDDGSLFVHSFRDIGEGQDWIKGVTEPDVLELQGSMLGEIVQASPVFEPVVFHEPAQLKDLLDKIRLMAAEKSYYLDRVLIADTNHETNQYSKLDDRSGFQGMLDILDSNRPIPRLSVYASAEQSTDSNTDTAAVCYHEAVIQACRGRRFIVTDGGAIGLAPRTSQVGDTIAALWADCGGTPYALRLVGERFKLVGVCYLDGYMPGQEDEFKQDSVDVFAIS